MEMCVSTVKSAVHNGASPQTMSVIYARSVLRDIIDGTGTIC
jgi:hypothetical protein